MKKAVMLYDGFCYMPCFLSLFSYAGERKQAARR